MEPYNQSPSVPNENLFELQVDQQSIGYLSETARWAKFLSIVGFVMCGIIVVFALFFGSIISIFSKLGRGSDSYSSAAALGYSTYAIS